jgi:hypothetical protein
MAEGVADARLLEELGVTARVTADVERDVIAAAYAAEAPEGGDGDGGDGDDAQQPQPVDEEVVRLGAPLPRHAAASGACLVVTTAAWLRGRIASRGAASCQGALLRER